MFAGTYFVWLVLQGATCVAEEVTIGPDAAQNTTAAPHPSRNNTDQWWVYLCGGLGILVLLYAIYYLVKSVVVSLWAEAAEQCKWKQDLVVDNNQDHYGALRVEEEGSFESNDGPLQIIIYDKKTGFPMNDVIMCKRAQNPSVDSNYDNPNKQDASLHMTTNSYQNPFWEHTAKKPVLIYDENGNRGYSYTGEFILPWNRH